MYAVIPFTAFLRIFVSSIIKRVREKPKSGEIEHKGKINVTIDEKELQEKFDKFIIQNCTPFAPADSSDRMKTALYQFFTEEFKFDKYDSAVQKIVLGKENNQLFVNIINLAKEKYKKRMVEKLNEKRGLQETPNWEVPIFVSYNSRYKKQDQPLSILKPFYTATQRRTRKTVYRASKRLQRCYVVV